MTKDDFIQKAREGGWQEPNHDDFWPEMLLDPKVWQAVGKTEKWGQVLHDGEVWLCGKDQYLHTWVANMHRMIDALCEGKTIEDFLKTL